MFQQAVEMEKKGGTVKPRILQVVSHLALGGAERVAINIIRGLHDRVDFAVYAVMGIGGDVGHAMLRELDDMAVPLYTGTSLPIKFGGLIWAGVWLAHTMADFKPDLVHVHTEIPEASYAVMASLRPRMGNIHCVRTIHNSVYWGWWRRIGLWSDRHLAASYIACVSKDALAAFMQFRAESGAGSLPCPPEIIFNGVFVKGMSRSYERMLGNPIRILFAGRLEREKGADLIPGIVRAIPALGDKEIDLCVYGSGTYEFSLRELATHPPAGWMIHIHPPIPNIVQRMPEFDLMIMPSRFEGLPLTAVEALMMGLPVVATDAPGLREVFMRDHPWLATPGDTKSFASYLARVLENYPQFLKDSRQARDLVKERFDIHAMCEAYASLYKIAMPTTPGL